MARSPLSRPLQVIVRTINDVIKALESQIAQPASIAYDLSELFGDSVSSLGSGGGAHTVMAPSLELT
jgi:hypothetical protein